MWLAIDEESSFCGLRCLIMDHVGRIILLVIVTCLYRPSSLPLRTMVLQHRLPSGIVCYNLVLVVILLRWDWTLFELGLLDLLSAHLVLVLTARKFARLLYYVLYLLKLLFIHASETAKLLNRLILDNTIFTVFILVTVFILRWIIFKNLIVVSVMVVIRLVANKFNSLTTLVLPEPALRAQIILVNPNILIVICVHVLIVFFILLFPDHGRMRWQLCAVQLDWKWKWFMWDKFVSRFFLIFNGCHYRLLNLYWCLLDSAFWEDIAAFCFLRASGTLGLHIRVLRGGIIKIEVIIFVCLKLNVSIHF